MVVKALRLNYFLPSRGNQNLGSCPAAARLKGTRKPLHAFLFELVRAEVIFLYQAREVLWVAAYAILVYKEFSAEHIALIYAFLSALPRLSYYSCNRAFEGLKESLIK